MTSTESPHPDDRDSQTDEEDVFEDAQEEFKFPPEEEAVTSLALLISVCLKTYRI